MAFGIGYCVTRH